MPTEAALEELRIAYFISSYGSGEQLRRLVELLREADPTSDVVIHHDPSSHALPDGLFGADSHVHLLLADEPIVWGDITLEAARWRVFRWILENLDVDWVMLLSEQDYPIAPLSLLRERLAGGADALIGTLRIDDITDPDLHRECQLRYLYQYRALPRLELRRRLPPRVYRVVDFLWRLLVTGISRLQRKVLIYTTPPALNLRNFIGIRISAKNSPFNRSFPCWYNNCWCALSSRSIEHLLRFLDENPRLVRYYERTIIPLESATATIMCNDPDLVVEPASLHAVRWTNPTSGRPDVFHSEDVDFLEASGLPFARKVEEDDTALLDELDRIVLAASRERR